MLFKLYLHIKASMHNFVLLLACFVIGEMQLSIPVMGCVNICHINYQIILCRGVDASSMINNAESMLPITFIPRS